MTYNDLYQALLAVNVGDVCPDALLLWGAGVWVCIERTDRPAVTSLVFEDRDAQPDMFLGFPRCWLVVSHISRSKIVRSGVYAEADGKVYGSKGKACDLWQQHRWRQKEIAA